MAATRDRSDVELGASPRASVALYRAAQAAAFLDGRDFVLPDDIRAIVPAVLGHRLRVDLDSSLHGATAERILADVVAEVPVPVDASTRAGRMSFRTGRALSVTRPPTPARSPSRTTTRV